MGLSLYYRFKAKVAADAARTLVRRLHAAARKLPFDDVSAIMEHNPPEGKYVFEKCEVDLRLTPGDRFLSRKRADGKVEHVEVPAIHSIWFDVNHPGSETATFGLATHPPVVIHREDIIRTASDGIEETLLGQGPTVEFPTRLRGWYSWSHCVKTQYASNPRCGGVDNFLRVHTSIFRMIDEAKRLGLTAWIRDDTKYWRHRDEQKLVAELERWNQIIAGVVGRLADKVAEAGHDAVAPIKDRPDFEHLEAKGVERLKREAKARRRKKGKREA